MDKFTYGGLFSIATYPNFQNLLYQSDIHWISHSDIANRTLNLVTENIKILMKCLSVL